MVAVLGAALVACGSPDTSESCADSDPTSLGRVVFALRLEGRALDDVEPVDAGRVIAASAVDDGWLPEEFTVHPTFRDRPLPMDVVAVVGPGSEGWSANHVFGIGEGDALLVLPDQLCRDPRVVDALNDRPGSGLDALVELIDDWPSGRAQFAEDVFGR